MLTTEDLEGDGECEEEEGGGGSCDFFFKPTRRPFRVEGELDRWRDSGLEKRDRLDPLLMALLPLPLPLPLPLFPTVP